MPTLSDSQRKALNENLPADAVKSREGGGGSSLSYVDGFYVFDTMNAIFGPGSWGTESLDLTEVANGVDDKGRTRVAYVAKVKLFVDGTSDGDYARWRTQDVGFGSGMDKDPGAAHEKAVKEASTDAVKRCARFLGRRMGLALYDKSQEFVSGPEDDLVAAFESAANGAEYEAARSNAKAVMGSLTSIAQAKVKQAGIAAKDRLGIAA